MNDGADGDRLRARTKGFALRIIRLYAMLPRSAEGQVIGRQLLRSGTSVGAHYREAHRSRSNAEFISKIEGGLQELEETTYWLELLEDAGIAPMELTTSILQEAGELTAILVTIARTAKARNSAR